MKITDLQIDDFGAWHNLTLDELGDGATVFYGPNEAGKTTILNHIRSVLYGFSEKRCARYLPPAQGSEAGGSISVSDVNGGYTVHRTAPAHYRGGDGVLRIQSERGDNHGNEFLTTLLAGVDETIFNNVFAVGLTQMQQLATLSDTEAANQLYGLATGVDRVSLYDVTRELEQRRETLLPSTSDSRTSTSVDALMEQKRKLEKELKALRRDEGHYAKLRRQHADLRQKIKDNERSKKLIDGPGDWSERSSQIRKNWSRCLQINDRLLNIGALVEIPKHILGRVRGINEQIKERRREWEKLRDDRRRIKEKATRSTGQDTLYQYAAEIEALERQRPRITALEEEVKRHKTTVEELEFEMQAEMEQLGLQTGTSAKQLPQISDQVIDALREPAREARELRESVEVLKKLAADRRKEAERVKGQLETAAVRFGGKDINAVLTEGMSLVENLERRINLDEHREGLVRRLDEVEEEAKYWQGRGVLPWPAVLTTCGVFSAGAALLATGLLKDWFSLSDKLPLPMMTIGGTLAVVSLIIKGSFESSARERADFFLQQVDLLHDEHGRAVDEVAEIDGILPAMNGQIDQQLIDARSEVAELDQYVPLSRQYQELVREAEAADHQTTIAIRQLKEARRGWKASLRTVGLPDSLTPAQIGQMTGRVSDVTRIRNRANEAKSEMQDREQELATIRQRIEQLLVVAEVGSVPDGLSAKLTRLVAELEKHSKFGKEREQLRTRWEEAGEKQSMLSRAAQQLYATRRQLLEARGVNDAREFRNMQRRSSKAAKLRDERDRLLKGISKLAGEEFTLPRLNKMLDKRSSKLIEKVSRTDRDRKSLDEDLKQLYERAGELKQKLDGHMQDRRGERKELEIQMLDEKIRQSGQQWHRSALIASVLDSVKKTYETKRQPVALAEASRHLERLTEGRYTRIWTPMGQSSLSIDDRHGTPLPVEKLSRGTRELVFLALRLALVSSYQRRGASMPIVLDDVFVNFDDQRARAAAAVLADLAQAGQQFLVFTCHKRIRDIFAELNADVRDLPTRTGLAKRAEVKKQPTEEPKKPEVAVTETPPAPEAKKSSKAEASLPVYDAESWDEAIEQIALPIVEKKPKPKPQAAKKQEFVLPDMEDEMISEVAESDAWQVKPAWRDEWLEPLPDLPS